MGGEEGLFDEAKVMSPPPSGAQVNGIVSPDDVEFNVAKKSAEVAALLLLNGDSALAE